MKIRAACYAAFECSILMTKLHGDDMLVLVD